jgi:type II restriction/modification system DNA methylase subunit YeeA
VPTAELRSSLTDFAAFARSLKGDEKGEAQLFLDHFFRALGHRGVNEAGATLEFRIAKKPGSAQLELIQGEGAAKAKGGKKFADLLWPERVLIEMKSRGQHLEKHYDQTFDYWTHIVPHRPPYVILCNFDEFWIYDFNTQLFDPVERLTLRDLPENPNALAFLFPHPARPIFGNNRVAVTRKAADILAGVFRDLVFRGVARERAQRFILQLLVALVSEDIGLLPESIVTRTLQDCLEGQSSFDLLGGLFRQMNSERRAEGGRFQHVDYFNGGLFAVIDPIELKHAELYALHDAAQQHDWSQVKPEIFGTIFQTSMDKAERHAFGAHFTSEFDIQKVVGPTIVRPWRERIAAAKTLGELRALLGELRRFGVLDPACGSGNFLYVAYREMKRLERELLVRLRDAGEKPDRLVSAIALTQFFGLDLVPFAVELARVTLMLAKELELAEARKTEDADGLLVFEKPLPLANLDAQILCADALFTEWPQADAIIGNPPYLGSRYVAKEHGHDYAQRLYTRFPGVPKMADFCTHWFRLAHDALPPGGRAGLVGTNTIRQNESRVASLGYLVENSGVITEAVSTQVWSGDAAVHVSIVNWAKSMDAKLPGEHTRPACWRRRPAFANFRRRPSRRGGALDSRHRRKFVSARRRNQHAGRVCSPEPDPPPHLPARRLRGQPMGNLRAARHQLLALRRHRCHRRAGARGQ